VRTLTAEELRAYREDGVVHLRGFFDDSWLQALREYTDDVMATPGGLSHDLSGDADPGRFFSETFLWHRNDGFSRFVRESPAAALAAMVMGSTRMNIIFDQLLVKEPQTDEPTVWHHDLTYWPVKGSKVATLWLALDEVDQDSGSMEFVRGSHQWGKRYHPVAFGGHSTYETEEPPVPDIDAMRGQLEFIRYDYEPGDCTIHHGLMVHYAGGNTTKDRRRRAYATRWAGDDVVYDPRPNIQKMLHDPGIAAGAALDSELWPRVWPKAVTS
jgi:ectoine hydroxylase-related dioxygenase (phytanoyl-CoA dioxygenase family)